MESLQKLNALPGMRGGMLCLISVLLMGVALLAGCGGRSDERASIQLSTWGSAQEITVLKTLLAEFERSHPKIRVQLLHIPENYYQKLHLLIAGDMTPDVIFTNSISFPIYAGHGVFRDLRPYLNRPEGLQNDDFYAPALRAFTWKASDGTESLGALPRDVSNLVVFYNKDLFQQAGLPEPRSGWTWQEFLETARDLTLDTNNDGDPDRFGVSFFADPPLFWLPWVWSAGGSLFDEDHRRFTLDQPEALRGLQFYANLRNQFHVAPKKVESGGASMSQLFLQQKLAMMVNGRWSVPVLREQAQFAWDVVPMPVGPSGTSRVGIDASGYAIAAKTAHPDECWALVQFLLSKPAIEKVTASGLIVPARPDVAQGELFLSPGKSPRHGRAFLDVIADGVPTNTPPRWNEIAEELKLALEPVWDGKQNAKEAVTAVAPKIQRMLEVSP